MIHIRYLILGSAVDGGDGHTGPAEQEPDKSDAIYSFERFELPSLSSCTIVNAYKRQDKL